MHSSHINYFARLSVLLPFSNSMNSYVIESETSLWPGLSVCRLVVGRVVCHNFLKEGGKFHSNNAPIGPFVVVRIVNIAFAALDIHVCIWQIVDKRRVCTLHLFSIYFQRMYITWIKRKQLCNTYEWCQSNSRIRKYVS